MGKTMEIEKQFKLKFKKSWLDDFAVFWRLIKEHRLRLILALLCSLAISGINGAIAWAVKPAMDEIFVKKNYRVFIYYSDWSSDSFYIKRYLYFY